MDLLLPAAILLSHCASSQQLREWSRKRFVMRRTWIIRSIGAAVAPCAILACGFFYLSFRRSATAHASPGLELLSALPLGAPTLVYLDLAAVRASSFYEHRPDK